MRIFLSGALAACLLAGTALAQTAAKDGVEFLVNTTTNSTQQLSESAALSGGGFVIVWEDGSASGGDVSGSAIRAQRYSAAGAAAGAEFLVNTTTSQNQYSPGVAALSGGGFVVVWSDLSATGGDASDSAVRAQRYDAVGVAAGAEFLVNTTTATDQYEAKIAALSGGGFVIAWRDASQSGGDASSSAIRAQRYDAAGATVGVEFLVNTTTANAQSEPTLAGLSDGGFVIAWTDASLSGGDVSDNAVRAQRYDAAGAVAGGEFLVNTTTNAAQQEAIVAALSGGGFVIAWRDGSATGGDTSSLAVRAQRYDAAGAAAGTEFLVNTSTTSYQSQPSIGALSDGSFMITWYDGSGSGGDASGGAVRAQLFSAAGVATGDEFLVNTTTANNQFNSSAAGLSGGGFVIAWTDVSATGADLSSTAIRAQLFSVVPAGPVEFLALDGGSAFTGQTVATEVGGTLDGDVVIDFGLDSAFTSMGAGGQVRVDFTLTNATFASVVPAGAWSAATDADCDFGAPSFGGGSGGTSVSFENAGRLNLCSGTSANDGSITLPIEVTANGDPVSILVTFTPTADAGSYTGSDDEIDLLEFTPAFEFSIAEGATGAGQFDADGDALTGSGILGSLDLAAFAAGIETDIGVAITAATDIAASAELVLTFPGGVTGIDEAGIDLGGVACTQGVAPGDNVFTCAIAGGVLDALVGGSSNITIADDGDALTFVTAQLPTASLTVTPLAGNTVAGTSGDLVEIELDDGLDVNAISGSSFAWVRFGSGGAESNFRISMPSEVEAQAVTEVRLSMIAGNGVTAGTVTLLPGDAETGFRVQGGTISFNSRALSAASGESGNANITAVSLQYDKLVLGPCTVANLSLNRMLINRSPGSLIVTPGLRSDNPA